MIEHSRARNYKIGSDKRRTEVEDKLYIHNYIVLLKVSYEDHGVVD